MRHQPDIFHGWLSHELMRNTVDKRIGYLPDEAQNSAIERKAKHSFKINRIPDLKTIIIGYLKIGWSPEITTGRLRLNCTPFKDIP